MSPGSREFPTGTEGLPAAQTTPVVSLADGERFALRIGPVAKRIGDATVRMLAYNGSVPGPTLRVAEGSTVVVTVENQGDLPATVHWHGLRLDSRYDGTHETQRPAEVGEVFDYRLEFPDPGIYWYHPHIRQDYGLEMGLCGNIIVVPRDPAYWSPAHRELAITLDDVLIEDGAIGRFSRSETTHSAMGRFGNHMLVNGEHDLALAATTGEVLRLYLANTANARVFNVALRGGRMKLVGGDSGRCEHELFVESAVLAPSERVVVDVLFEAPGIATLVHQTPGRSYDLATVTISEGDVDPAPTAAFGTLRTNPEWEAERERIAPYRGADPDRTIAFIAEMDLDTHGEADPHAGHGGSHGHDHAADGIEWEDEMVEANRQTTSANMRWRLVDRSSGAEDGVIDWRFRVGDQVKIRLVNELDSDHPMHHPFHIHGAGRFLVLSRDGREEPNLVWTDTVLVRTGEVIDILLDVTHPGRWMAHCHIAEHHESGMALSFEVIPREQ